ncbi:MAG: four helix bundle protein [Daejeonella sp.]
MTGSYKELKVYQLAFEAARTIFEMSKKFPKEETYALTDQIRRSSRSVCANIGEKVIEKEFIQSILLLK